jgi:hypothetical protein
MRLAWWSMRCLSVQLKDGCLIVACTWMRFERSCASLQSQSWEAAAADCVARLSPCICERHQPEMRDSLLPPRHTHPECFPPTHPRTNARKAHCRRPQATRKIALLHRAMWWWGWNCAQWVWGKVDPGELFLLPPYKWQCRAFFARRPKLFRTRF